MEWRRTGAVAALFLASAWAAPAAANLAIFDAALRDAYLNGSGRTDAEVLATLARLEALRPPQDVIRRRRLDALECLEYVGPFDEGVKRADALIAKESSPDGDRLALALAYACRGEHLPESGAIQPQIEALNGAVQAAHGGGDDAIYGTLLVRRAGAYSLDGEFAKALLDALAAQEAFDRAGDAVLVAINRQFVGIAYRRIGEHVQAESILRASLEDPLLADQWVQVVTAHLQLGYLYDETGQPEAARRAFGEALKVCREENAALDCAYAHLGLAGVDALNGEPERALKRLDDAAAAFATAAEHPDEATANLIRGQALLAMGRHVEAIASVDDAIQQWRDEDNDRYLAMALPTRAAALEALGRHAEASRDWRELVARQAEDQAERSAQRTELMREQFEARRREIENAGLRERERQNVEEIAALRRLKRWQNLAMGLGGLLLAVVAVLALRQRRLATRMETLASTDALTAVPNRRALLHAFAQAFASARQRGSTLSALAIDIDHFKRINDTHGHAAGDVVLQRVAAECQAALRRIDLLGRIGGEEFAAVLPGADATPAAAVAERLRRSVEALRFDEVAPTLQVTISVGIAEMRADDADFAALLARADTAMYAAKRAGRNRVETAGAPAAP